MEILLDIGIIIMMEKEREVISFMSVFIYDNLIEKKCEVIKYAVKTSDTFTLISNQVKPYSLIPPKCEFDDTMSILKPYIVNQIVGIKKWPGTETRANHKVMTIYKSCSQAGKLLCLLSNIFLPLQNNLPEDICFYRNNDCWFETISHEKLAFGFELTKNDLMFFYKNEIMISD